MASCPSAPTARESGTTTGVGNSLRPTFAFIRVLSSRTASAPTVAGSFTARSSTRWCPEGRPTGARNPRETIAQRVHPPEAVALSLHTPGSGHVDGSRRRPSLLSRVGALTPHPPPRASPSPLTPRAIPAVPCALHAPRWRTLGLPRPGQPVTHDHRPATLPRTHRPPLRAGARPRRQSPGGAAANGCCLVWG